MDDTALDEAKKEALGENDPEPSVVEEAVDAGESEEIAEEVEEVADEVIEEELPTDHKERSNLGRKVAALLKKTDQQDEVMMKLMDVVQTVAQPQQATRPDPSENEPMTKGEFNRLMTETDQHKQAYEDDFRTAFDKLSSGLSESDKEGVAGVLMDKYNVVDSGNGVLDGASAFHKAHNDFFGKKTPLQNKKVSGVSTKQKVNSRQKPLARVSAAADSYLKSVASHRGKEAALKLREEYR